MNLISMLKIWKINAIIYLCLIMVKIKSKLHFAHYALLCALQKFNNIKNNMIHLAFFEK